MSMQVELDGSGSLLPTWPLALENLISSHYTTQQLPYLADLYGQGVLIYPDFQVAIQAGKYHQPSTC